MFLVHILLCFFSVLDLCFYTGHWSEFSSLWHWSCVPSFHYPETSQYTKQMSSLRILLHFKFYIIPQKVLPVLVFRTLKIAPHILDDLTAYEMCWLCGFMYEISLYFSLSLSMYGVALCWVGCQTSCLCPRTVFTLSCLWTTSPCPPTPVASPLPRLTWTERPPPNPSGPLTAL